MLVLSGCGSDSASLPTGVAARVGDTPITDKKLEATIAQSRAQAKQQNQTLPAAGGCKVDSLATTLVLKMTLPRWTAPAGADADLRRRWERYVAALQMHEEGHVENARLFEKALKAELGAMTAPNCPALEAAVQARHGHMQQEYRQRDLDYDQRTGHGRTQGAEFRATD